MNGWVLAIVFFSGDLNAFVQGNYDSFDACVYAGMAYPGDPEERKFYCLDNPDWVFRGADDGSLWIWPGKKKVASPERRQ